MASTIIIIANRCFVSLHLPQKPTHDNGDGSLLCRFDSIAGAPRPLSLIPYPLALSPYPFSLPFPFLPPPPVLCQREQDYQLHLDTHALYPRAAGEAAFLHAAPFYDLRTTVRIAVLQQ